MKSNVMLLAVALATSVGTGLARAADDAEPAQLQEVVITAQKRPEKLQDVPVAASVVSGEGLTKLNMSDISDLNRIVPSVQLNGTINGRVPLGIRGISSISNEGTVGLSSGVAIMIDGVPVPSDSRAGNALEDVQSIEVLKGPQATLGGRTAAAGVINIVTHQPTDSLQGSINLTMTNDGEYRTSGLISGPISDRLEYSFSGYYSDHVYPIKNIQLDQHTDEKVYGGRGKLLFKATDDLDILLTARYGKDNSNGANLVYTHTAPGEYLLTGAGGPPFLSQAALLPGITPSMNNLDYTSPVRASSYVNDFDTSLVVTWRLGDLTLGSTTAYQNEQQINYQDLFAVSGFFWNELTAGTAPPFYNLQSLNEDIKQVSEELKLVSPTDRPVSYLVGIFYSDTLIHAYHDLPLLPALNVVTQNPDTKTADIYGRLTWHALEHTSVIAGLRYNYDQISYHTEETANTISFPPPVIVGPYSARGRDSQGTPVGDLTFQQQLASRSMAYFTYAHGYSPMAYNTSSALTPTSPVLSKVSRENIDHFELGAKGTYLDGRANLNIALFDTRYKDFQVQVFDERDMSVNPPLALVNAAGAETRGIELDSAFVPTALTRLDFNAAYVDAKFTNYIGAPCYYALTPGIVPTDSTCYQSVNGVRVTGPGQAVVSGPVVQDLNGRPMPNSPRLKATLSAQQRVPLSGSFELALAGNYSWRSRAQMLADQNPYALQGSFGILNLSVALQDRAGRYGLTFFGNNVFRKVYYTDIEDFWSSPWGGANTVIGQPARDAGGYYGLRFSAHL